MQSFKIGSENIRYEVVHCTLTGLDGHSETHITGGGGGGVMYDGTGAMRQTHISSTVLNRQKLYVRFPNGREDVIELTNWNFSGRAGNELLLIYAESRYSRGYAYIYNRTFDRWYTCDYSAYFKRLGSGDGCVLWIFCAVVAGVIPAMIGSSGFRGSNEDMGWVAFLILGSICTAICIWFYARRNTIRGYAPAMKQKIEKIFRDNV